MQKKVVRIEQVGSEVRLIPKRGVRSPFDTADEIYFCSVLPGERLREKEGFVFDLNALGQQGLSELRSYLESRGCTVESNEKAETHFQKITSDRNQLRAAIARGSKLKKHPERKVSVPGLKRKLKPFQVPAVAHMINVDNSANFSVPGSGKTTITLAAFAMLESLGVVKTLIVIGPRASFAPWEKELKACFGNPGLTIRVTGNKAERGRAWRKAESAKLVLLNYHVASNDRTKLKDFLSATDSMLVLDESHHIKSITDGKWASAVSDVAPLAKRRVILSGTPVPNSLLDLWSQINFLYPEGSLLGSKDEFMYRVSTQPTKTEIEVQRALWPLFWRIKKRDLSLPRPTVTKISVKLGEVQSAIYNALAAKVLRDYSRAPVELHKLRLWRRARMVRLLQAATNPTLLARQSEEFKIPPLRASGLPISHLIDRYPEFEVPSKITTTVSLVGRLLRKGRKVVIWTSFVHNIRMLLKLLADASPLPLYGGIALSEEENAELNRENIIDRFCNDRHFKLLIANPAACAESISLHRACRDAVYLDRTFNCAHFLQSKDRIHRLGLTSSDEVNYYLLLGADTIDEVVDLRLVEKQRRMLALLEADFGKLNFDVGEDIVSEESDEELDFTETLKHIKKTVRL